MPAVTIDLPEDLLARLDRLARWRRTTREALLTDAVEHELAAAMEARRARASALLAAATGDHGGDNARHIRELRGPCR